MLVFFDSLNHIKVAYVSPRQLLPYNKLYSMTSEIKHLRLQTLLLCCFYWDVIIAREYLDSWRNASFLCQLNDLSQNIVLLKIAESPFSATALTRLRSQCTQTHFVYELLSAVGSATSLPHFLAIPFYDVNKWTKVFRWIRLISHNTILHWKQYYNNCHCT